MHCALFVAWLSCRNVSLHVVRTVQCEIKSNALRSVHFLRCQQRALVLRRLHVGNSSQITQHHQLSETRVRNGLQYGKHGLCKTAQRHALTIAVHAERTADPETYHVTNHPPSVRDSHSPQSAYYNLVRRVVLKVHSVATGLWVKKQEG